MSHFELVEKVGEGGMGQVWKAIDTKLDRIVAIKFLNEAAVGDPRRLASFEGEAKAIAALSHPNIVTIYSVEEHDLRPFFAME
ncbi:MAG: protein kinase, partial [Acidobacteriota bacterium]